MTYNVKQTGHLCLYLQDIKFSHVFTKAFIFAKISVGFRSQKWQLFRDNKNSLIFEKFFVETEKVGRFSRKHKCFDDLLDYNISPNLVNFNFCEKISFQP